MEPAMTSGVAMQTHAESGPEQGRFYLIDIAHPGRGKGHGVVIANLARLLTPPRGILRPRHGGFPHMSEVPQLVHDPERGDLPRDLEASLSGYWLVSERLKEVLQSVTGR
ncbi:imm11 family protein [Lysobacter gummosus]|uniref:imm11 family protein n=1 Tax=Lysobacter gummosus TaxID=262324 RepID=UPI0036353196